VHRDGVDIGPSRPRSRGSRFVRQSDVNLSARTLYELPDRERFAALKRLIDVTSEAAEVAEYPHGASARMAQLYQEHAPRTGRLAYLLTGDAHVAEDLAQEAFVRLIGRLGAIRDEEAIAAYLRQSVVNLARNHWRKRGSERAYLRREGPALVAEASARPDFEARDELWEALGSLPYRQRAALVLRFYEDLSERQTARVLGCAVGTVKSSVSRGLRQMKERLTDGDAIRN
jgi:RNA polymerase sigma-70 factor (sigma-E family)